MTQWHRTRRGDLGLRGLGLGICVLAYLSLMLLARRQGGEAAEAAARIVEYLLAATGFLSASGGSAMLLLGAHLFDAVEVGERWRVKTSRDGEVRPGPLLLQADRNEGRANATRQG